MESNVTSNLGLRLASNILMDFKLTLMSRRWVLRLEIEFDCTVMGWHLKWCIMQLLQLLVPPGDHPTVQYCRLFYIYECKLCLLWRVIIIFCLFLFIKNWIFVFNFVLLLIFLSVPYRRQKRVLTVKIIILFYYYLYSWRLQVTDSYF